MANLSVLSPGKLILDIFGMFFSVFFKYFFGHLNVFFQKIRSGPLTLARQGSILAEAPTVPFARAHHNLKIVGLRTMK